MFQLWQGCQGRGYIEKYSLVGHFRHRWQQLKEKKKSRLTMCFKIHVGKKICILICCSWQQNLTLPPIYTSFCEKSVNFSWHLWTELYHHTYVTVLLSINMLSASKQKEGFFFFFKRVNCFCKKHICRDELFSFSSWHMLMYQVYQVHVTYGFIS